MASEKKAKPYLAQALSAITVAFELGFIIALPVAVLAAVGQHYDHKFHTHYLVYIGMAIALASSGMWLYLRLESMVNRLQKATELSKSPDKPKDEASSKSDEHDERKP